MTQRTQLVAAIVLISAVTGGVLFARPDPSDGVEQSMEGHDHAAMLAGMDEAQPVTMTQADARRIGVSFTPVTSKVLTLEVRALGITTWDERRLHVVNPKVAGWVEILHVDFTGAPIREGEPLLDVYSPDLVTAQEELVLAAPDWEERMREGNVRSIVTRLRPFMAHRALRPFLEAVFFLHELGGRKGDGVHVGEPR